MIGLQAIGTYIPSGRISNYERKALFEIDDAFIEQKIGVRAVAVKGEDEETSDLCVKAFEDLRGRTGLRGEDIETLIVVTQNPDSNIPHTSAIVHGKLALPDSCACFDISLGCSGYVYGLSVIQSFMEANGFRRGLLFTADPYSKVVDPQDKNTALLFGDAATVTLISDTPCYRTGAFTFGTLGKEYRELVCVDGRLLMNGRQVFNFSATRVPGDITALLRKNGLGLDGIDLYVLHQGSKYIVDTIVKRLSLPPEKVLFDAYEYGNTVSSSIPLLLAEELPKGRSSRILISGFGVGLSWAGTVLFRI